MFKTRVTEKLGIKYPIVGGAMMYLSKPKFVAAMSDAGALGIACSAMWKNKTEFRDSLKEIKDHTDQPFAVNLNLFPAMRSIDNNVYLDEMLAEGVKIVETSGHKAPEDLSKRFKAEGLTWIHKCVGLRYAKKAAALGADIVTVVGFENGGATGVLDLGTFILIPRVAEALSIPVIGGGGVSNGRGLVAALALGAEGVIVGTRFLLSREAPLHDKVKEALVAAEETDTVLVMRTVGNTHRLWKNERADLITDLEAKHASLQEIVMAAAGEKDRQMFECGEINRGTISCGQGVGLCHDVKSCKEIVADIMREAEAVAGKLTKTAAN